MKTAIDPYEQQLAAATERLRLSAVQLLYFEVTEPPPNIYAAQLESVSVQLRSAIKHSGQEMRKASSALDVIDAKIARLRACNDYPKEVLNTLRTALVRIWAKLTDEI